jgi:hypothetical protein
VVKDIPRKLYAEATNEEKQLNFFADTGALFLKGDYMVQCIINMITR